MKKALVVILALIAIMVFGGFLLKKPIPKFVPGELLVKYKPTVTPAGVRTSLGKLKAEKIVEFRHINVNFIKLPRGLKVEEAITLLQEDLNIEYVEPNYIYELDFMPNDPRFGEQWGLHNTGASGGTVDADIDAPEAWDSTQGDPGIIVAITDTGVDYTHEDLVGNMWANPGETPGDGLDNDTNGYVDDIHGYDFANNDSDPMDDHNHGTHVAGIIGAVGNNNKGIAGVNLDTQLMALKFIKPIKCGGITIGTGGSNADAAEAIIYATDNNARIINASWGGESDSATLRDAIAFADSAGVLFVAAAGNGGSDKIGDDNDTAPHYPSNYGAPPHNLQNVIAVAATDRDDNLTSFSNFGNVSVHVGAPGARILSTIRNNDYTEFDGTSMAAPHVAGVAALVWSQHPTFTHTQVKNSILDYVNVKPSLTNKVVTDGRLNADGAVRQVVTYNTPDLQRLLANQRTDLKPQNLRYVGHLRLKYHSEYRKIASYFGLMLLPIAFIFGWKTKIRRKDRS
jgi:subtilisin family serine protease